jgi:hypothetical protein
MATISIFFGIVITMYYNEHGQPHFHAEYQGQRGVFNFSGNMIRGNMRSNRAKNLIREWALLHRDELERTWNDAREGKTLFGIAPLE